MSEVVAICTTVQSRLTCFRFLLTRGDEVLEVRFYAASASAALRLASTWAAQRGWVVEGSTS